MLLRTVLIVLLSLAVTLARAESCAPPPPPLRDLVGIAYYTDGAHSLIDPQRKAQNAALAKPLNDFLHEVVRQSDRWIERADPAAAQCALSWLASWAQGGAFEGEMRHINNNQADYMRQNALAVVGIVYLKTRSQADADSRAAIEPWLRRLAVANLGYWQDLRRSRNNHYYWTGLGVMAAAIACHDAGLRSAARAVYRSGIDAIQDDGSLPLEMHRGERALLYHNYALEPLVMMAELAPAAGEDWYGYRDGRIDLLARRVAAGQADSRDFAAAAGAAQQPLPAREASWVAFYLLRAPSPAPFAALAAAGPFRNRQLGGDLSRMAAQGILH
jgi:poly(beta-D-mannuronate) lyase